MEPQDLSVGEFSIAMATPTHGGSFCIGYVISALDLQRECNQRSIGFETLFVAHVSIIEHARNRLANLFLWTTNATHLLFVDDDMGFGVPELMKMFEWRRADVVAAMCPKKSIDWARIKRAVLTHPNIDPAVLPALAGNYENMFRPVDDEPTVVVGPKPSRVSAIGAGIMLISRECLMRLVDTGRAPRIENADFPAMAAKDGRVPYYQFFRTETREGMTIGEDMYFCEQVRASGGEILGCSWIPITHTGRYDFRGDLPGIAAYRV
nr:hypothetical protein [Dyella sp. ASV24]